MRKKKLREKRKIGNHPPPGSIHWIPTGARAIKEINPAAISMVIVSK